MYKKRFTVKSLSVEQRLATDFILILIAPMVALATKDPRDHSCERFDCIPDIPTNTTNIFFSGVNEKKM